MRRLQFDNEVGPLSLLGESPFFASWAVLSVGLWRRDNLLNIALIVFAVLTVAGLIGTFPTFFQAFG
jgi:hypothetical protein